MSSKRCHALSSILIIDSCIFHIFEDMRYHGDNDMVSRRVMALSYFSIIFRKVCMRDADPSVCPPMTFCFCRCSSSHVNSLVEKENTGPQGKLRLYSRGTHGMCDNMQDNQIMLKL